MTRKRILLLGVALMLLLGGGLAGYRVLAHRRSQSKSEWEMVSVTRGSIVATVEATGNLSPQAEATLTFRVSGQVKEILVEKGQRVKEGELLARLDARDLELSVAHAKAILAQSEARLAQVKKGPSEEELAAAEASLASAQANYEKVLAGPDPNELAAVKASLEKAQVNLKQAQAAYDLIAGLPGAGAMPQAIQLQMATIDYEAALAQYNKVASGPTEAEIKAAEAQVAQARAQLEKLRTSPSPEDIAIAQAQVDQARASLEQAKFRLEGAFIYAPFDGVVADIRVREGELVGAGVPAILLVDDSSFHLEVNVDEIDIGQVQAGQPVTITLDAFPDIELSGHVESIAPTATQEGNLVYYAVAIALDSTELPLRTGMSANVSIVTERLEDVLLVPNRAIHIDLDSGQAYVEKLVDGEPVRVDIEIGRRDELFTQVKSGLEEGDQLVIRTVSTRERLRRVFRGRF